MVSLLSTSGGGGGGNLGSVEGGRNGLMSVLRRDTWKVGVRR